MQVIRTKAIQKQMDKDPEIRAIVLSVEGQLEAMTREQLSTSGLHLEKKHTRKNREVWSIRVNAGDRIWCNPKGEIIQLNEFFQHDAMMRFLKNGAEEDILTEVMRTL